MINYSIQNVIEENLSKIQWRRIEGQYIFFYETKNNEFSISVRWGVTDRIVVKIFNTVVAEWYCYGLFDKIWKIMED